MKNIYHKHFFRLTGLLLLGFLAGCSTVPEHKTETGKAPIEKTGWIISVAGLRSDEVKETDLENAKVHSTHYKEIKLEKKGELRTYKGIPFYMIAAMVDGPDSHHPYKFDKELWEKGYEITVTAEDGYSATFNTLDVPADALYLVDFMNETTIAPSIVGNVSTKLWVKNVSEIELSLKSAEKEEAFKLAIESNGEITSYSIKELEAGPFYIEDMGSYTTSAGTQYTYKWGGVKFADLLKSFIKIEDDSTITVVALDGYEMSYSGSEIMDESDGVWILAFKADGEYLPLDPGYVRSIKVGPGTPDIEGHSSARMIAKIIISGEAYKDFTLTMTGKMNSVLDRQTIQTGISCHKTIVNYYDRKKDTVIEYKGIPLWCLLACSDDLQYAPHKQDSSILSYNEEAAKAGYKVKIEASDGYSIVLDSKELNKNDDVIIAMYSKGKELDQKLWPLILVWDKDAEIVPGGIKSVRNLSKISLIFDE